MSRAPSAGLVCLGLLVWATAAVAREAAPELLPASWIDEALAWSQRLREATASWIAHGWARMPAAMVGLAMLLLIPPLALLGGLIYRGTLEDEAEPVLGAEEALAAASAFVEIDEDGLDPERLPMIASLLQIGRQSDNDICLADATVHGYHAVIERTPEHAYVITDLSGPDGNGVRINGELRTRARLLDGDVVELGRARLRFALTTAD